MKQTRNKASDETVAEARRLYAAGVGPQEIAERLSVTIGALGGWLYRKHRAQARPDETLHAAISRQCKQCNRRKALTEYARDKNAKQGRRATCKACEAKRRRERHAEQHKRITIEELKRCDPFVWLRLAWR